MSGRDFFWIEYMLIGVLSSFGFIVQQIATDEDPWDTPIPLIIILAWPLLDVVFLIAWAGEYVGNRLKARMRVRRAREKQSEDERRIAEAEIKTILKEHGLD